MGRWPLTVLAQAIGHGDCDVVSSDSESFRRQERLFALLNLFLIGALLALQAFSRFVRGRPAAAVVWVLAFGLVGQAVHLTWLNSRSAPSLSKRKVFTFWSLGFNSAIAFVLTFITIKGDQPTTLLCSCRCSMLHSPFRLLAP